MVFVQSLLVELLIYGNRVATGKSVAVTVYGTGYTHGTIYTDSTLKNNGIDIQQFFLVRITWTTDPVFDVIIGPDGGHGSNPAKELGGNFVMMDVKLQQTETFDFSVVNDFRQVGIKKS